MKDEFFFLSLELIKVLPNTYGKFLVVGLEFLLFLKSWERIEQSLTKKKIKKIKLILPPEPPICV